MAHCLEKNLKEDYLTCSICFDTFKDPRKLSCGHSFCYLCLKDYAGRVDKTLSCPMCRRDIEKPENASVEEWISLIPHDNLLDAIVSAVYKHSEDKSCVTLKLKEISNKICAEHGKDYNQVCLSRLIPTCSDCVDHKNCTHASFSDANSFISSEIAEIDSQIVSQLTDIAMIEQNSLLSLNVYQKQSMEAVESIKRIRSQVQQFYINIISDLQSKTESLDWPVVDIKSSLKKLKMQRSCLEQARADVENIKVKNNVLDKLEAYKICRESTKHIFDDKSDDIGDKNYKIKLVENQDLLTLVNKMRTAVRVEIVSDDESKADFEMLSAESSETEDDRYMKKEWSVNKSHQSSLSGICFVETYIVAIDQFNNCCIKMSIDGAVLEKMRLAEPYQVCRCLDGNIAITCWDKNCIHLLQVEPELASTATLRTTKHYLGISCAGYGRFVVTSADSSVDIISITGDIILSINQRRSINILKYIFGTFSVPVKAMMKDDTFIICDSVRKTLVRMDLYGTILWQTVIPRITSITCGPDFIYCTLSRSNKITTVSFDGKVKDECLLQVRSPWAIDVEGDKIILTEDAPSAQIHLIDFNKNMHEH